MDSWAFSPLQPAGGARTGALGGARRGQRHPGGLAPPASKRLPLIHGRRLPLGRKPRGVRPKPGDESGVALFQREDDRRDSVKVRLETYEKSTAP